MSGGWERNSHWSNSIVWIRIHPFLDKLAFVRISIGHDDRTYQYLFGRCTSPFREQVVFTTNSRHFDFILRLIDLDAIRSR